MPTTWLYFVLQFYKSTALHQPTEVLVAAMRYYVELWSFCPQLPATINRGDLYNTTAATEAMKHYCKHMLFADGSGYQKAMPPMHASA